MTQKFLALGVEQAVGFEQPVGHFRVGPAFAACGEALQLDFSCGDNAIAAEGSARSVLLSSLYSTAGASTWMSMRSRRGAEILLR